MRYVSREVAGWFLVALGLYLFWRCVPLMTDESHYILEGCAMTLIGVIIFRGGIHLLKIAVAAEVVVDAQRRLEADEARPARPAAVRFGPARRFR